MRDIAVLAIVVTCYCGMLSAAKPMETLERCNVVLIHGAAPEGEGFESKCNDSIKDASSMAKNYAAMPDSFSWRLGGAVGMLGAYDFTFNPDSSKDYNDDAAKKLTYWLDSAVFEDTVQYGSEYVYIQRSFANPAESPAHNAHEIGDRTWKGNNNCSIHRSLIEEAQEVRAGGQDRLRNQRIDSLKHSYRTIPSRNILVGHSMGGEAI